MDNKLLNLDIAAWVERNFGETRSPLSVVGGLAEETGEVCRAAVKDDQGIRGTHEEWMEELQKEVGDVYIKLVDVATFYGFDLQDAIEKRWSSIRMRDWVKDPVGHGI